MLKKPVKPRRALKAKKALSHRDFLQKTYPSNWDSISKSVIGRDEERCSLCGRTRKQLKPGERFEVHHIQSVRTGNNRRTNLTTLCSTCHATRAPSIRG